MELLNKFIEWVVKNYVLMTGFFASFAIFISEKSEKGLKNNFLNKIENEENMKINEDMNCNPTNINQSIHIHGANSIIHYHSQPNSLTVGSIQHSSYKKPRHRG
ncbi:MAG: hypothetical protein K0R76_98 [Alphaproteobacteria bacterium]|jgi:hypothetical protein|nr:hypothetical protein [Alphaproteobacteria bacterium]